MNSLAAIIPYTYGVLALLWAIILFAYLRYWKVFPAQSRSIRLLLLTLAIVSISPLTENIYRLLANTSQTEFHLLPLLTGFFSAIAVLVVIILRALPALRREAEGNPLEAKAAEKESKAAKFNLSPELQVMLEHTPNLSYFKNSRSRYVAVSQRFADFLGRPIDDILGKTDYELLPNDIAAELHKLDREVYRSGRAIESMESALKRGDGQMRWLSSRKHAFRSEHGNILGILSISDDLTEHKLNERALLMNQYAMNSAKEGVFWIDRSSKFIYVNETACQILGYSQEELLSMRMPDVLMNITEELLETIWEQIEAHQNTTFEATHLRKNGTEFPIEISANYLEHENKEYCCLFTSSIGKQKDAEQQLQLADKLIETTSEGILVSDPEGFVTSVNSAFTANSGYEPNDIIGEQINILYSGHHEQKFYQELWENLYNYGQWQGEIWNQHKNGILYPSSLQISAIYDSNGYLINYVSIYSDTSLQQEHQRRLHRLGYYDSLTGLPSRPLLEDRLLTSLSHAQREEHQVALLYVDLDNFKKVNDSSGHAVGDQLIQAIAERLQGCLKEVDTLARISGDEFIIILPELHQLEEVGRTADKMLDVINSPVNLNEQELKISASIGISLYPDDANNNEQLTKCAEQALQQAKNDGCNRYQFYTSDMRERTEQRLSLEKDLHNALKEQQLILHYQPQINVQNGEIMGVEALLRWQHPERGLVLPDEFIPFAEESGFISQLGDWVLLNACQQTHQWQQEGHKQLSVSINISPQQLLNGGLVNSIKKVLDESKLNAESLLLELKDGFLLEHIAAAAPILEELNALGVQLVIDNFGNAPTSISQLKTLPIKHLKIDRKLIQQISDDPIVTKTLIGLGASLDLPIIAEGVETQAQLDYLRQHQCHTMQGFLLSQPVEAKQLSELLNKEPKASPA